jgi:hypothetical protein
MCRRHRDLPPLLKRHLANHRADLITLILSDESGWALNYHRYTQLLPLRRKFATESLLTTAVAIVPHWPGNDLQESLPE